MKLRDGENGNKSEGYVAYSKQMVLERESLAVAFDHAEKYFLSLPLLCYYYVIYSRSK